MIIPLYGVTRIDVNETREHLQNKLLELADGGSAKTAGYISDVVRGLGRVAVLNRACYGSPAPSA
jgi:hypothetical protein